MNYLILTVIQKYDIFFTTILFSIFMLIASLEFIKKQLQNYLNPGSAEEGTPAAPATDKLPESLGQQKTDFTLETATAGNKDTVSKFDDLFNE